MRLKILYNRIPGVILPFFIYTAFFVLYHKIFVI
jgi:hypothetical protein